MAALACGRTLSRASAARLRALGAAAAPRLCLAQAGSAEGLRRASTLVIDDKYVHGEEASDRDKAALLFEPGMAGGRGRRRPGDGGGKFTMPQVYWDMLAEADGPGTSSSSGAAAEPEEGGGDPAERQRSFWRSVRTVARQRLAELSPPEASDVDRRVADLRESLWVEELGSRLELQKWRFTVNSIPQLRGGLFAVDVSDLDDELLAARPGEGFLRGVMVEIRPSEGSEVFRGLPQPGSKATSLLVDAEPELAYAEGPFEVQLKPLRFQMLAMHRALASPAAEALLRAEAAVASGLPTELPDSVLKSLPDGLNEGQRRAVAAALQPSAQHPLLVWGPPGTGKSTLAAFIIWLLVHQRPNDAQVLVAAPSNTAADLLCSKLKRLGGLGPDKMLRLNALGRSVATVSDELREHSFTVEGPGGKRVFGIPGLRQLQQYKIVVTTCICAAHLSAKISGPGTGWFSHVVVDEAGEATEPETLVALSLLRPVASRAVLLGDHFQLGPLVMSPVAKQLSRLDLSMLERLVRGRFALASEGGGDDDAVRRDTLGLCIDKGLHFLTESYRSHPDIMDIYSSIFYSGELEHSPRREHDALIPFFKAKGLSGPVLLHNVVGVEQRDVGSKSVFNSEEVRLVATYLRQLLEDRSLGLEGADIGVITPYNRQVLAIERHLGRLGPQYASVDVGTVERFQGQERKVIVVSTVRSSRRDYEAAPTGSPIGFVADKKRMNVAVSRAVAGLIVVGDLRSLATFSSHWRQLVEMGEEAGALRGEPLLPLGFRQGAGRGAAAPPPPEPQSVSATQATMAWDSLTAN